MQPWGYWNWGLHSAQDLNLLKAKIPAKWALYKQTSKVLPSFTGQSLPAWQQHIFFLCSPCCHTCTVTFPVKSQTAPKSLFMQAMYRNECFGCHCGKSLEEEIALFILLPIKVFLKGICWFTGESTSQQESGGKGLYLLFTASPYWMTVSQFCLLSLKSHVPFRLQY